MSKQDSDVATSLASSIAHAGALIVDIQNLYSKVKAVQEEFQEDAKRAILEHNPEIEIAANTRVRWTRGMAHDLEELGTYVKYITDKER